MTIQEALDVYHLPFTVEEQSEKGGYVVARLVPNGASATVTKLRRRLQDIEITIGEEIEMSFENHSIYLTYKTGPVEYNLFDYRGSVDCNSEDAPFIVGFSKGQIVLDDLENARHILVAGTTGSGKSVFLHGLINTFLYNPNVCLYLVDYKGIEFSVYENRAEVAYDNYSELSAERFVAELSFKMEERLMEMQGIGATSFSEYKKFHPEAQRHVLIIDELSNVILDQDDRDFYFSRFHKIAQSGRYTGFHLILSTQLANNAVTDDVMRLNMPTRIAFRTVSKADSRKILDDIGAECLGGSGDALYHRRGSSEFERVQTPNISYDDILR